MSIFVVAGATGHVGSVVARELLAAGRGKRSRIGLLWGNVSHDNEQYAQLATYMRLKNIMPPSASEK